MIIYKSKIFTDENFNHYQAISILLWNRRILFLDRVECQNQFYCTSGYYTLKSSTIYLRFSPTNAHETPVIFYLFPSENVQGPHSIPTTISQTKGKPRKISKSKKRKRSHGIYQPIAVNACLITDEMKILGGAYPPPNPPH